MKAEPGAVWVLMMALCTAALGGSLFEQPAKNNSATLRKKPKAASPRFEAAGSSELKLLRMTTLEEFGMRSVRMRVPLLHRDHAAVRHFADDVLELNGGVLNSEPGAQLLLHLAQNLLALRRRNVGN